MTFYELFMRRIDEVFTKCEELISVCVCECDSVCVCVCENVRESVCVCV